MLVLFRLIFPAQIYHQSQGRAELGPWFFVPNPAGINDERETDETAARGRSVKGTLGGRRQGRQRARDLSGGRG